MPALERRVLVVALAVALQVQVTLSAFSSDVRVALSDILLPLLVCVLGYRLIWVSGGISWRISGIKWWFLAIAAAFCLALFVGYRTFGHWSTWALVNKWCGMFALAAYFLVGGAIVRLGGGVERQAFLMAFMFMAAVVAGINILAMPWLVPHYSLPVGVEFNRATGLMQNPNAFGFLLAVCALLAFTTVKRETVYYFAVPALSGLWFASSRGAFLALVAGTCVLLALRPACWRVVLKTAAFALPIIAIVTIAVFALDANRQKGLSFGLLTAERFDADTTTVRERQAQNKRAIGLFLQAPILGHGLGYFMEETGRTLHNSLLWLVLEMGLVGTIAVVGFLFAGLGALYLGRDDPFAMGMVAVAVAFMTISLTGEFLYQRHLWVLLGMALAVVPPQPRAT